MVNKFFALRENGISLPHLQESTTGTYPKQTNPVCTHICNLNPRYYCIRLCCGDPTVVALGQIFRLKICNEHARQIICYSHPT
jgi:hypothetical protein